MPGLVRRNRFRIRIIYQLGYNTTHLGQWAFIRSQMHIFPNTIQYIYYCYNETLRPNCSNESTQNKLLYDASHWLPTLAH